MTTAKGTRINDTSSEYLKTFRASGIDSFDRSFLADRVARSQNYFFANASLTHFLSILRRCHHEVSLYFAYSLTWALHEAMACCCARFVDDRLGGGSVRSERKSTDEDRGR